MQSYRITENFNLNDGANQLVVNATLDVELENGSYNWSVVSLNTVEIQFGYGARSIDITSQVKNSPSIDAIVTSQVADQDEIIVDSFREQMAKRRVA